VVDGQTVSHDANGNQVAQGPVSYQWDARNRLVGITGPGTTASFTYDALGRRATRTINGQTQAYQYDGADIIRDADAEYVQGPGIDNVLDRKEIATGNNEYYLKDHLGSTIALTDQSGNITTQYAYSPFGQVAKTGANSNNYFEYTGRENDGTGLYFYRARYYSPQQKRFIAEDPLGFRGGDTNLYAYVYGNPIKLKDPSGLLGAGFSYGQTAETGNGAVGAAESSSAGTGVFTGKEDGPTIGSFHSEGGFAGGPYGGPSLPPNTKGNFANGAYTGYGPGVFFTNADTAEDAAGKTSRMFSRDFGIGVDSFSVQLSYGEGGIFVLNIGLPIPGASGGVGNGYSHMPTTGKGIDTPIFGQDLRQQIINDLKNQLNYPALPSNLGISIGGIGKRK
jgi:RHS repeat-associated protein